MFFFDLGWKIGFGMVDVLAFGWSSGGAVGVVSVLCRFFGVRPRLLNLLGVFWLPVVTCA